MATLTFSTAECADIPVLFLGLPAGHGVRLVEVMDRRNVFELDVSTAGDLPRAPLTTRRALYAHLCDVFKTPALPESEALVLCQMLDYCADTAWTQVWEPRDAEGAALWPTLNDALVGRAFVAGTMGAPSVADWALFSVLHLRTRAMPRSLRARYPELVRWAAHMLELLRVRAREALGGAALEEPLRVAATAVVAAKPIDLSSLREALAQVASDAPSKSGSAEKGKAAKAPKAEKAEKGEKTLAAAPKADVHPLARVDLRVGRIVSVEKHPNADRLYVEQVDVGDAAPRQVVSGLYPEVPIEEMRGRLAVFVCNLKPAMLCKTLSAGMILVAVDEGAPDRSVLEPVLVPEGARPGDRVSIAGVVPQPDAEIKAKDTTWADVKARLSVVGGTAMYDGTQPLVLHGRDDIADNRLFSRKVSAGPLS